MRGLIDWTRRNATGATPHAAVTPTPYKGPDSVPGTSKAIHTTLTQEASSNIARARAANSDRSAATAAGVTPPKSPVIINARQTASA